MVLIRDNENYEKKAGPRIGDQVSAIGMRPSYEGATNLDGRHAVAQYGGYEIWWLSVHSHTSCEDTPTIEVSDLGQRTACACIVDAIPERNRFRQMTCFCFCFCFCFCRGKCRRLQMSEEMRGWKLLFGYSSFSICLYPVALSACSVSLHELTPPGYQVCSLPLQLMS